MSPIPLVFYSDTKLELGSYLKISDYDGTKLVLVRLQSNLSGFTVVFAEVLTGKQISNHNEFQKIDELFIQHGKMPWLILQNHVSNPAMRWTRNPRCWEF